jgi:chromate transporter
LTVQIAVAASAALFRWKVSNPLLIAASAGVGLIAFLVLQQTWVMVR